MTNFDDKQAAHRSPAQAAQRAAKLPGSERGADPAAKIFVEASRWYLRAGRRNDAQRVIEVAYRRFQEPPGLMPALITTYRSLGKQRDAERVASACALRYPKVKSLCLEAAGERQKMSSR